MSWSYDEQLLDVALNRIRMKLGDTDPSDPQLQDEEIQLLIDETDSDDAATKRAARVLAARYARSVDKWVGDLKILASQRHRAYLDLYESLSGGAQIGGVPTAGGVYVADKEAMQGDDSLVKPAFRRGMHDNEE